ncbi:TPM domain-containing protein [Streptomyces sp. NPDC052016]|uniref:TPM domain-containing protein n=1 Tax=Streptomyces sp. NPDC052016 TaxID=3365680 RepID=UPI0037CCE559
MTRLSAGCVFAVLMAVWWLVMPTAKEAVAQGPVGFSQGQMIDRVGALGNGEQVGRALDRLVVHGRDFSGRFVQPWVQETAERSRLAMHVTDARAGAPALRQSAWAGSIGGVQGHDAVVVLSGDPVPAVDAAPGNADPDQGQEVGERGGAALFVLALFAAVFLAIVFSFVRGVRRRAARTASQDVEGGWPEQPAALPELDAKARKALVDTDDAVRTSQEELGFAVAQFGEEATRPFAHALEQAKAELTAAFRLRQQLDDAYPEDDETRWRMLDEIMVRCAAANRVLDAESEDFDRLRAFERNAPHALAAAEAAAEEASGRLVSANAAVAAMRERYTPSATTPVERDLHEAQSRLEFARNSLPEGRRAVERNDNGAAAIRVRAAEAAVAQARRLIDAVDRRARELHEAAEALPGALTETDTDLAEARGLLQGAREVPTAALQGRIARAETVATTVRQAMNAGRYDPIDALRRVEEADAGLDEALAGARENELGTRRSSALLERALLAARSSIGEAGDYIITHRGGVGSEARTRLNEAQRRLALAESLSGRGGGSDAHRALAEAQRADELAQEAQVLAQRDVEGYMLDEPAVYGVAGPGMGLAGAMLGGIVLGGFGGPVTFGGGATRGRMGGGFF